MLVQPRRGIAGIIGAVILFTMLFTIGASYFLFVSNANSQYNQNLLTDANVLDARLNENMIIATTLLASNNHVGFFMNNTGGLTLGVIAVLLTDSSGTILACFGSGITPPSGMTCPTTVAKSLGPSASFPLVFNPGKGSPVPSGGYYDAGTTCTTTVCDLKIVTQRGNIFAQTYPPTPVPVADLAVTTQGAGLLEINFDTFRAYYTTGVGPKGFGCDPSTAGCQLGNWPGGVNAYSMNSMPTQGYYYIFAADITNVDPRGRTITLDSNTVFVQFQTPKPGGGGGTASAWVWGIGAVNNNGVSQAFANVVLTPCPPGVPSCGNTVTIYFSIIPSQSSSAWPPGSQGSPFVGNYIYLHGTVGGAPYGQNIPFTTTLYS